MQREVWLLIIKYDNHATQYERDPELAFPNDEVSQVIGKIHQWSGCIPEELPEFCEFNDTNIKLTFDTLQNLDELMSFILNETIPVELTLTRGSNAA